MLLSKDPLVSGGFFFCTSDHSTGKKRTGWLNV
jgi:hypothetical protein